MKNKMKEVAGELFKEIAAIFIILVVYSPFVFVAQAQSDISDSTGIVGNGRYLGAKTVDGQLTVPVLGVNASTNTEINALSGKGVVVSVAKTPVSTTNSNGITLSAGKNVILGVNSPVLISTPITGTNYFPPGLSVVPPTATANTAAFVGVATPIAGTQFTIYNSSASSVYVKAAGGATINGTQAAGRFVLATLCRVQCEYTSTTNLSCTPPVCATPLAG